MHPFAIVSALGAAQAVFLAALLFTLPNRSRAANLWLCAFILSFGLLNAQDAIDAFQLPLRIWQLAHLFDPLILAMAPLLYFYIRELTGQPRKRSFVILRHFLPAIAIFALLQLSLYAMSPAARAEDLRTDYQTAAPRIDVVSVLIGLQMLLYWAASYRLLRQYDDRIKQSYSEIEHLSLKWLQRVLGIVTLLLVIWLVGTFNHSALWSRVTIVAGSFSIYALGYIGLRKSRIFVQTELALPLDDAHTQEHPPTSSHHETKNESATQRPEPGISSKYARSGLSPEKAGVYLSRLDHLMTVQRPYLENSLTLRQLASQLRISPHHLSQVINQQRGETFFDYINRLRVEEAQRCLADPAQLNKTVLDIAFDCGFSSKASFNAAFRKYTQTTPTAYRQRYSTP